MDRSPGQPRVAILIEGTDGGSGTDRVLGHLRAKERRAHADVLADWGRRNLVSVKIPPFTADRPLQLVSDESLRAIAHDNFWEAF